MVNPSLGTHHACVDRQTVASRRDNLVKTTAAAVDAIVCLMRLLAKLCHLEKRKVQRRFCRIIPRQTDRQPRVMHLLVTCGVARICQFQGWKFAREEDAAALTLFCLRRSRNSCGHYAQRRSVCLSSSVPQRRERRANPIIKPQLLFSHRQKSIGALLLVRSASSSPPSSILGPQTDLGC